MTDILNDESIDDWLKGRKGWNRSGNAPTKDFEFSSFRDSIVFVNRVAGLADGLDHHPDIDTRCESHAYNAQYQRSYGEGCEVG